MENKLQKSGTQNAQLITLNADDSFKSIIAAMPEHDGMLKIIDKGLPEVQRASSLFYKTQSQFMDNMMTVSANTPIRNLRQILAEMTQTRQAVKEAYFKLKKKDLKKQMKEEELAEEARPLKKQYIQLQIDEINDQAETTSGYISGAIRKLTNYQLQYNQIMTENKLEGFNEEDFEKEEERYHIMRVFEQALCAARTRHDRSIDEGNMIYLTQIGINGAGAQREIHAYLAAEDMILQGKNPDTGEALPGGPAEPTHRMYVMFLERMAEKYAGSAATYAALKGMKTATTESMIAAGDMRLADSRGVSLTRQLTSPEEVTGELKKL